MENKSVFHLFNTENVQEFKGRKPFPKWGLPNYGKGKTAQISAVHTHTMLHKQFAAVIYTRLVCREQVALLRIDVFNVPLLKEIIIREI